MIGKILNSRYHIIRQLGQGGFGATFIAEDRWQNQKHCVIKQLKPDVLSPATQYLFEKEAEILFKLGSHNQIPQLLAHFQEDGVFYIVQEFIEGNDLNQEIKRGQKLGETQVIKLLIEILEVLEYVHQNQVIHRDIKPANIIRRRDGKIVLIDFGGIKQVRARSANSTLLTAIIGTPGYTPMEQFNNNAQFCSDIHAVGMMGIFALTGIDPDPRVSGFSTSPQGEILWRDKAQVSRQLADVIDKMVKFDYRQRYQLVREVLAALKGLIYSAQPINPSTITTPPPKNPVFATVTPPQSTFSSPHQNWRCVRNLEDYYCYYYSLAISPDGQLLASGIGSDIKLWQVNTGREIRSLIGHFKYVKSVAFSPDGQFLASGSGDCNIKLWQVSTGREIRTFGRWFSCHSKEVNSVTFSQDGQLLASSSEDKTIKLWDVNTGREIRAFKGHSENVICVAISPDGQLIASGSVDKTIKIWKVSTGGQIRSIIGHSNFVMSLAFSPDGQLLASGSADNTIKLWDLTTGREIRTTLFGHTGRLCSLEFSRDGQLLASGSADDTIKIWQVSTGREICTLFGHSKGVICVAISRDGQILASSTGDKTIKIWQRE